MIDEIKRQLSKYEIIRITESNFEQVMEVYNTNQKFFIITDGKETTSENSIKDISAIPPDFDIANKIYISIWEKDKIIGVLDLLKGYPEQNCAWIGLLLIHGELHGKRIGSNIVAAVLEAAKNTGYETVQLGVIENNLQGLKFWDKHGFKRIRESKNSSDSATSLKIVIMEKRLT